MSNSQHPSKPKTREGIEDLLKMKIDADEAEPGLFDTGSFYVLVERDEKGGYTFSWYDVMRTIDDVLGLFD